MKARKPPASVRKQKKPARTGARKPSSKVRPVCPERASPKTIPPAARPRTPARHLQVYRAWCKKCGICTAFCPAGALTQDPAGYPCWAEAASCTNCSLCELRCPDFAIEVFDLGEKDRAAAD